MLHVQTRSTHPRRNTILLVTGLTLVVTAVVGFLAGVGGGSGVPVTSAATGVLINCGLDATVTSALRPLFRTS